jgi:hypothetical protein
VKNILLFSESLDLVSRKFTEKAFYLQGIGKLLTKFLCRASKFY